MALKPRDLKKGEYYLVGNPIRGILKFSHTNVPQALVYGDLMDVKTGGVSNVGIKLAEIEKKMSADLVYYYQKQFIKGLLDF